MPDTIKIVNDMTEKIKELKSTEEDVIQILDTFLALEDDAKKVLLENFYQKFLLIEDGWNLLNEKKNKLFSSKEEETYQFSISLYGESFSLKRIFNNLEDGKDKTFLWVSLKVLLNYLKPVEDKDKVENEVLKIKVDRQTNEMIEDVVKLFKNKVEKGQVNPLESIMEITGNITEKYAEKIQSGEIRLDSIMDELQTKIPGVKDIMSKMGGMGGMMKKPKKKKDKVIIDENFSTANVKTGDDKPEDNNLNLSSMLSTFQNLPFGDLLGKMDEIKTPEDLEKMKGQMNTMFKEQFNMDMDQFEKQFNNKKEDI
jgi:hypothetical protein